MDTNSVIVFTACTFSLVLFEVHKPSLTSLHNVFITAFLSMISNTSVSSKQLSAGQVTHFSMKPTATQVKSVCFGGWWSPQLCKFVKAPKVNFGLWRLGQDKSYETCGGDWEHSQGKVQAVFVFLTEMRVSAVTVWFTKWSGVSELGVGAEHRRSSYSSCPSYGVLV